MLSAMVSSLWRIYNISIFGNLIYRLPYQSNQTLFMSHGKKLKRSLIVQNKVVL